MAVLTKVQKLAIQKELKRRAQAKMAWKAGGGTSKKTASMKGWAGFGAPKSNLATAQQDYIKSLGQKGGKSTWKTSYKKAAAAGGKAGKAKVETYISNKGAGAGGKPPPVKMAPKKTPTSKAAPGTAGNLTEGQKWYRRQKAKFGGDAVKMQKVRAMHKQKYGKK